MGFHKNSLGIQGQGVHADDRRAVLPAGVVAESTAQGHRGVVLISGRRGHHHFPVVALEQFDYFPVVNGRARIGDQQAWADHGEFAVNVPGLPKLQLAVVKNNRMNPDAPGREMAPDPILILTILSKAIDENIFIIFSYACGTPTGLILLFKA